MDMWGARGPDPPSQCFNIYMKLLDKIIQLFEMLILANLTIREIFLMPCECLKAVKI